MDFRLDCGFRQIFAPFCVLLLYMNLSLLRAEKHSLYYIHTGLSKPVYPAIPKFTAVGLLDDREIHFHKEQRRIPKQKQTEEKTQEEYWRKAFQLRKTYKRWFIGNFSYLVNSLTGNKSELYVLQWRHGCEVELQGNEVKFSKGLSEYGLDGENFIYFNNDQFQWVASAEAARTAQGNWNKDSNQIQHTRTYLEKECVNRLGDFRKYEEKELRNASPPQVYVFAVQSIKDKTKLKLTCLATGLLIKDVRMDIRKNHTSLPEDGIESTGVRPNHDGSSQMRKSVEIKKDEKAEYECYVAHRTFKEPIITKFDGKCRNCPQKPVSVLIAVIGVMVMVAVITPVIFILKKKKITGRSNTREGKEELNTGIPLLKVTSSPDEVHPKNREKVTRPDTGDEQTEVHLSSRGIDILGKSGAGKSANTILARREFRSEMSTSSVTSVSSAAQATVSGRSVCVVDTPGFFHTQMSPEKIVTEIARGVYLSSPGPHTFLIVFRVNDRFTEVDWQIPQFIKQVFGQEALKYSIVLFTHGDQLRGITIEELIQENSGVKALVDQCGGRFQLFNNRDTSNRAQVKDLLLKIDSMVKQNGGAHYSTEMMEKAQRLRREEEEMGERAKVRRQREEEQMKQEETERVRTDLGSLRFQTLKGTYHGSQKIASHAVCHKALSEQKHPATHLHLKVCHV